VSETGLEAIAWALCLQLSTSTSLYVYVTSPLNTVQH